MRIAFGTDERTALTDCVLEIVGRMGHEAIQVADGRPWPEVGKAVGQAVARNMADMGVVCCSTGTGVSIAANKVPGVRAALCTDSDTAKGARRWNDANVLALGLQSTSLEDAEKMIDAFLATAPDETERPNIESLEAP